MTHLDFSRFKILTFDCYGTLIDWESGIFSALRPILAAHGKSISDAQVLEMYGELEAQAEQGEFRSYRDVLQLVVSGFGKQLGFEPSDEEKRSLPESSEQLAAVCGYGARTGASQVQIQTRHNFQCGR